MHRACESEVRQVLCPRKRSHVRRLPLQRAPRKTGACESEFVQEYLDFLSHTNTSNEWQVLKVFRRAIEEDSMFAAQVAKSVYLVHGPITTHFTKECIELLFKGRQPRRIVTEAPLDISVNEDYDISNVSVRADFSVVPEPDASTVEKSDSDSVEYSLRIMNAFLRILVNSCDELALATAMASPVFKLPHDAFKELKRLSLQKNSPMCLTMVAIEVVICTIGRCIRSACGHGPIWKTVLHCQANLVLLARRFHEEEDTENLADANDATLGTADSANTLRILRRLTDFLSTRHTFFRPLSVMDNRDANSTPLRIPHLLEYFKTPEPESEDDGYDVPLKQRLLEQFEREGATHLIAALHAMTDSGHKKKRRKSSIRKLPDKDTSFVSAQKEEPSVVQKKATRKGSSLQAKPSAARKVAKRSILDDINSASKKQRLSSFFSMKQRACLIFRFKFASVMGAAECLALRNFFSAGYSRSKLKQSARSREWVQNALLNHETYTPFLTVPLTLAQVKIFDWGVATTLHL
ncbi:hypothetical protein HPB51_028018 [Rhipicephalus microplus]|uniref:PCNA-interacting partner n=1 Tax=Rhipicephalus microplus TaxID=6941 RepID=A0A9J6CYN6_RHIMP|nr:hypothetical protein HPB51_028018 [Rhipicephalus microplus]